jgi:hypothetical protein
MWYQFLPPAIFLVAMLLSFVLTYRPKDPTQD